MSFLPGNATVQSRWTRAGGYFSGAWLVVLLSFYAGVLLNPLARYHGVAPVFVSSSDFIGPFFRQPGGLTELTGAFLAQLDAKPSLGVLKFFVLQFSLGFLLLRLGRSLGTDGRILWLAPIGCMLLLYNQYLSAIDHAGLQLMLSCAALNLWLFISAPRLRWVALFVVFAGLFWISGMVGAGIFILAVPACHFIRLSSRVEGASAQQSNLAIAVFLGLFGVWALVSWFFRDSPGFDSRMPSRLWAFLLATFLSVPTLCWLTLGSFKLRRSTVAVKKVGNKKSTRLRMGWFPDLPTIIDGVAWIIVAGMFFKTLNLEKRANLRIQAAAESLNWALVLEAGKNLQRLSPAARIQIQRALYHTGQLVDRLFTFPQRAGYEVLAGLSDGLEVCLPMSDTLLELGHVNLAERFASEFFEIRGERPELLWRLAWINLVKERPKAAAVFLSRLKHIPFYRTLAERWLRAIELDSTLANETEVMEARRRRVPVDDVQRQFSTALLLKTATRPDHSNPMVDQYQLAQLLLTRQTDEIVSAWASISPKGWKTVPKHLAEALLSYAAVQPGRNVGWEIEPQVKENFDRFRRILSQSGGGETPELGAFAETYWYFELTGRSGRSK